MKKETQDLKYLMLWKDGRLIFMKKDEFERRSIWREIWQRVWQRLSRLVRR